MADLEASLNGLGDVASGRRRGELDGILRRQGKESNFGRSNDFSGKRRLT
jgi:hypothetical protein